jgi:hypothetical protein
MHAQALRTGREPQDLLFAGLADGFEIGELRFAEQKRSPCTERRNGNLACLVPVCGGSVGDAAA